MEDGKEAKSKLDVYDRVMFQSPWIEYEDGLSVRMLYVVSDRGDDLIMFRRNYDKDEPIALPVRKIFEKMNLKKGGD